MKKWVEYSKGHWYSLGFLIGLGIGFGIGALIKDITIGPVLGVGVGAILGVFFAEKYTPHSKEYTAEEIRKSKIAKTISIGIGLIVLILVIGTKLVKGS